MRALVVMAALVLGYGAARSQVVSDACSVRIKSPLVSGLTMENIGGYALALRFDDSGPLLLMPQGIFSTP